MTKKVTVDLWFARLKDPAGGWLVSPLFVPGVLWVEDSDQWPGRLPHALGSAIQKRYVEAGDCLEVLKHAPVLDVQRRTVSVTVPKSTTKLLYPELTLEYDVLYYELPSGMFIGHVPALGIESHGDSLERLEKNVSENILVEFARKKRFVSVASIVATRWFQEVAVRQAQVPLTFHTVKELRELRKRKKRKILPEAASKMLIKRKTTFGLENELTQLTRLCRGRYTRSILIIGPSGAGKTALVKELRRVKSRFGMRRTAFWETNSSRMIQKLTGASGWKENLATMCGELREQEDILYVRNFAELFEVGQYVGSSVSMADFLRDYIQRGEIVLISECTDGEAAVIETMAPGYLSLFETIRLEEPGLEKIELIVHEKVRSISSVSRVTVDREAVREILRLQRRYTPYSGFPGKTIRFLESAILGKKTGGKCITRETTIKLFCEETGMPDFMIDPGIPLPLGEMKAFFQSSIFGQEAAVETIVNILAAVKTALARRGKPIASLLFVGPTGVGKTEMAKVLANYMFGSKDRMIRFDMSEFSDLPSVMRLTGDSFRTEGLLTSVARQTPFSVILFDELEKAHYSFFDLLLQVLGEGRLTDARGRVADFCNTIIIMTSNIGTGSFGKGRIGLVTGADSGKDAVGHFIKEVRDYFRPELFNRLDQVIPFSPLNKQTVRSILGREMKKVRSREGIKFRELDLEVPDEVLDCIAREGYDTRYGAREMQRTIREKLLVPLAHEVNRFPFSQPLAARTWFKDDSVSLSTEALSEKDRLSRLVEEAGCSLLEIVDRFTDDRRVAQCIESGSYFVRLLSKLDILKKEKRRCKKQTWKMKGKLGTLDLFEKLAARCFGMFADIGEREAEAALMLFDEKEFTPAVVEEHYRWRSDFMEVMIDLYEVLNPAAKVCTMGIYGDQSSMLDLIDSYLRVGGRKGFEPRVCLIYLKQDDEDSKGPVNEGADIVTPLELHAMVPGEHREVVETGEAGAKGKTKKVTRGKKKKKKPAKKDKGKSGDEGRAVYRIVECVKTVKRDERYGRIIGAVVQFTGRCPYLYFRQEMGCHVWQHRGTYVSHKYVIDVKNHALERFRIPQNIHRQKFFKGLQKRRLFKSGSFTDKVYREKREVKDMEELIMVLGEILDGLFFRNLTRILIEG